MSRICGLVLAAALCLVAPPLNAQNSWANAFRAGDAWNAARLSNSFTSLENMQELLRQQAGAKSGSSAASNGTTDTSGSATTQKPRLAPHVTYRPSPEVHTGRDIATAFTKNKSARNQVYAFLKQAYRVYQSAAARHGRRNDLGYALAFALTANYVTIREHGVPSGALRAVARQMDAVLEKLPAVAESTDIQRQAAAERLVMASLLAAAGVKQAKTGEQQQAFQKLAEANLNALGIRNSGSMCIDKSGLTVN